VAHSLGGPEQWRKRRYLGMSPAPRMRHLVHGARLAGPAVQCTISVALRLGSASPAHARLLHLAPHYRKLLIPLSLRRAAG
jgi:hypothetical protein